MRLVGGAPWFPSSLALFSWTWGWVSLGSPVVLCCVGMATSHLASSYGWVCVCVVHLNSCVAGPLGFPPPLSFFRGLGGWVSSGFPCCFWDGHLIPCLLLWQGVCVCVWTISKDVKLVLQQGVQAACSVLHQRRH